MAAVASEPPSRAVEEVALALVHAAVSLQEVGLALTGEEAEVLTLGLARDGEVMAGGDLAHLRLGQLGERKAQSPEHRRRQRRQHVALVLLLVGRRGQEGALAVLDDARVVAGDEVFGAESPG